MLLRMVRVNKLKKKQTNYKQKKNCNHYMKDWTSRNRILALHILHIWAVLLMTFPIPRVYEFSVIFLAVTWRHYQSDLLFYQVLLLVNLFTSNSQQKKINNFPLISQNLSVNRILTMTRWTKCAVSCIKTHLQTLILCLNKIILRVAAPFHTTTKLS